MGVLGKEGKRGLTELPGGTVSGTHQPWDVSQLVSEAPGLKGPRSDWRQVWITSRVQDVQCPRGNVMCLSRWVVSVLTEWTPALASGG